jgi:hypothetical protein
MRHIMPKRSPSKQKKLVESAFHLLDNQYTKRDICNKLGISIRTLQRWIKEGTYESTNDKAQEKLEQISLETIAAVKVVDDNSLVDDPLQGLTDYMESQRWFAIQLGVLAAKLLPVLQLATEQVSPEDISVRSLPQLLRAVGDLADNASSCWARATGLEEVLSVFRQQVKSSGGNGTE